MAEEEVLKRLTVLEIRQEERWKMHDKNSEEHWSGIQVQLSEIKESIGNLVTCREYNAEMVNVGNHIRSLWGAVGINVTGMLACFSYFFQHVIGGHK